MSVPAQKRVPRSARMAAYPAVERDSFAWAWVGDPGRADSPA